MDTRPELTQICERCGYIVETGWGWKDFVSFVVCTSCANIEGEQPASEIDALDQAVLKSQEQCLGESYCDDSLSEM